MFRFDYCRADKIVAVSQAGPVVHRHDPGLLGCFKKDRPLSFLGLVYRVGDLTRGCGLKVGHRRFREKTEGSEHDARGGQTLARGKTDRGL